MAAETTGIEWTGSTWNPVTGCDRVSPGCDNCYALTLAKRLKAMGNPRYQVDGRRVTSGPGFGVTLHHDQLELPLRWKRPRTVFVNSMSDLFHPDVPDDFIASVFDTMERASAHTFQILTKRPRRAAALLGELRPEPLPNAWIGTSVEDAERSWRIDVLRRVPAAVRFLSLEPLLSALPDLDLDAIDWVIAGGESGPGYRPMDISWVRDIRDRCQEAGVAFFFKQWGGRTPKAGGRELDERIWDGMPESAFATP